MFIYQYFRTGYNIRNIVSYEELCHAFEIDTKDTIERSKNEIREKINWFLRFADLTTKADDFVKSATMNPAFEESAMFENMTDLRFKNEYDFYVFNTTPTANARRLLGMSNVYSLRVAMQDEHMEEAWSTFKDSVHTTIPLLETKVKGGSMLNRMINHLVT